MVNPYEPSEATSASQASSVSIQPRLPMKRMPMMITLMVIAFASLLTGGAMGLLCAQSKGVGQDETEQIISFFMSFAIVFGVIGMYLSHRYMAGRISILYVLATFGSIAFVFALTSTPNYRTVTLWIAGLAACSAVSTTAIAAAARSIAYSANHSNHESQGPWRGA